MSHSVGSGGRVRREAGRVRFIDDDGAAWTLWDTVFARGHHRRVPLGDRRAHYRVFVNAEGVRRAHRFAQGEGHDLEPAHVGWQFARAGYVAVGPRYEPPADPR